MKCVILEFALLPVVYILATSVPSEPNTSWSLVPEPSIITCPNEPVLLAVMFVKLPVLAVVKPIGVLSIVPPSISGVLISGLVKVLFSKVS